jgi:N-methylhydantoinase A/oxoprolinase/acetone carboxylase beta subunit
MLIIGVDTGGTFTDFIWKDGRGWGEDKIPSTPANPAEAVLAGRRSTIFPFRKTLPWSPGPGASG